MKELSQQELFKDVLENDEQIIGIIKPVKKRYYKPLILFAIPIFWPHFILLTICTLFTLPFFFVKGYKNLYYAYTNKRLICRRGWTGVSFDSLEYKDITATSITVGFWDKGCQTGSLFFSSPSVHSGHAMSFNGITNPYENMRAIREQISLFAENNK